MLAQIHRTQAEYSQHLLKCIRNAFQPSSQYHPLKYTVCITF